MRTSSNLPWWQAGLRWALFMFLFNGIFLFGLMREPVSTERLLRYAAMWLVAGLLWGGVVKYFANRTPR